MTFTTIPTATVAQHQLRTYHFLVALRCLLVLVPQTGYIHPDEFFQSLEPMAGDEFGLEHTRTWEFNATAPIRSIALPYLTIRVPLNLLRLGAGYFRHYLHADLLCGYMLLVWPRLIALLLSFANDWSLRHICSTYNLRPELRLVTLASSWVLLIFGTRTFSNTAEMALASVLLAIVAECMHRSSRILIQTDYLLAKYEAAGRADIAERVRLYKLRQSLPSHSMHRAGWVATICVVGVFNRPTFVLFAGPAVFFWLLRGMGTRTMTFVEFHLRIAVLQVLAVPTVVALVVADSVYYGYMSAADWQAGEVGMANFVVTPVNWLRYNGRAENRAEHGEHGWWQHGAVNAPLLWGVLAVVAAVSVVRLAWRFCTADFAQMPRAQSVLSLMLATILVPLIGLSCVNHQEPRFLLPLTLPIIFTYAPELIATRLHLNRFPPLSRRSAQRSASGGSGGSGRPLLHYWYAINLALATFFGFVHQGGVVQLASHLEAEFRLQHLFAHSASAVQTHLVTSHLYSLPPALLFMPSTQTLLMNRATGQKYTRAKTLYLYEYGSSLNMDQLYARLLWIVEQQQDRRQKMVGAADGTRQSRVLLALPTSLGEELSLAFWRSNSTRLRYRRVHVFYPHLSTEAMPSWRAQRHPAETAASLFGKGALGREAKCTLHAETNDVWSEMWQERAPRDWLGWGLRQFSTVVHQLGLGLYRVELDDGGGQTEASERRESGKT